MTVVVDAWDDYREILRGGPRPQHEKCGLCIAANLCGFVSFFVGDKRWSPTSLALWERDCKKWRGKVLTGEKRHWCADWDGLPVDETTEEFSCCTCWDDDEPEGSKEGV